MNRLTRYRILDAYTLEELQREYEASDVTGRIRLLRKLSRSIALPYEIVLRAVEDPSPQVRAWIARNANDLDFRERQNEGGRVVYSGKILEAREGDYKVTYSLLERNLSERLRNDPDPFVRACLLENKAYGCCLGLSEHEEKIGPDKTERRPESGLEEIKAGILRGFGEQFQKSSTWERLALVRNPAIPDEFIWKIFDYQDKELAISSEEREGLILACLTNKTLVEMSEFQRRREERYLDTYLLKYIGSADEVERHLSRLWELAASWPDESGIPGAIYTYVYAPDSTKAKFYQAQKDDSLRRLEILLNCDYRDSETLKLGTEDHDFDLSRSAYEAMERGKPTKSPEEESTLKFREEVRGELQGISSALRSVRGWVFAIAAVVFCLMATRLFGDF